MEWTWQQQAHLFLQSGGVGFALGMVYDVFRAAETGRTARVRAFVLDALFGVTAALVTFYAALAIMDGRLHPLLFAGCGIGFAAQRRSVGRLTGRIWRRVFAALGRFRRGVGRRMDDGSDRIRRRISRLRTVKPSVSGEKGSKKRKKFHFFRKKA